MKGSTLNFKVPASCILPPAAYERSTLVHISRGRYKLGLLVAGSEAYCIVQAPWLEKELAYTRGVFCLAKLYYIAGTNQAYATLFPESEATQNELCTHTSSTES